MFGRMLSRGAHRSNAELLVWWARGWDVGCCSVSAALAAVLLACKNLRELALFKLSVKHTETSGFQKGNLLVGPPE